jgi:hypothetical protein
MTSLMFFAKTARGEAEKVDDEERRADLSRITLEFTAVKPDGLHVESAEVAHSTTPTAEERDELKREALEESSQPTPA